METDHNKMNQSELDALIRLLDFCKKLTNSKNKYL